MRIALIGQAPFGKAVLEAIADAGMDEVVGVFPPPDREGRPPDPVKEAAIERDIPVYQPGRYRTSEAISQFRALSPDLGVMAFVTDIVPPEMIDAPRLGTIQYHPSLLPKHRGPSSMNWPIIFGETKTGLSVFWPDQGLDTGPVLLQKEAEIDPDDTLGSLYFNKLFPLGVQAMVEAIDLVRAGDPPRIPQDESEATYESWCTDEVAGIDWSKPAAEVYNLIRGCNPRPGAHTTRAGSKLGIFDTEKRGNRSDLEPGQIGEVTENGFEVGASGGAILVKRVQPAGSRKISAAEYAAETELQPGDVLGD